MSSRIVLAHNDSEFIEQAVPALRNAGYGDITVATDEITALLNIGKATDLLITRIAIPHGTMRGLALALFAKRASRDIKIIFAAKPEFSQQAKDLGEFLPLPVNIADFSATVRRVMR